MRFSYFGITAEGSARWAGTITVTNPRRIEFTDESSSDEPTYFWGTLTTVYGYATDTRALVVEQTM